MRALALSGAFVCLWGCQCAKDWIPYDLVRRGEEAKEAVEDANPIDKPIPPSTHSEQGLHDQKNPCEDRSLSVQPVVNQCTTGEIQCGEIVHGDTQGGLSQYSNNFYRQKYCVPLPDNYSGPERVYHMYIPADNLVEVELYSPCADLDLFAMVWSEEDRCPTVDHNVSECEAGIRRGGDRIKLFTDHNPKNFLVVVDGKLGVEAPFALEVRCTPNGPR